MPNGEKIVFDGDHRYVLLKLSMLEIVPMAGFKSIIQGIEELSQFYAQADFFLTSEGDLDDTRRAMLTDIRESYPDSRVMKFSDQRSRDTDKRVSRPGLQNTSEEVFILLSLFQR